MTAVASRIAERDTAQPQSFMEKRSHKRAAGAQGRFLVTTPGFYQASIYFFSSWTSILEARFAPPLV
jgi:hypothetical protein